MAKVELKQPIVQEISENIKDAQSVVVVNYLGLTVAEDTELRKQLREAGVVYKVYKNTLVNFAIKALQIAWKDRMLSQSLQQMRLLRQESWLNLQRPLRHLKSKPVL